MSFALEATSLHLPLYLVAVSFVAPTLGALHSERFQDLEKSLGYLATTTALGHFAILWTTLPPAMGAGSGPQGRN